MRKKERSNVRLDVLAVSTRERARTLRYVDGFAERGFEQKDAVSTTPFSAHINAPANPTIRRSRLINLPCARQSLGTSRRGRTSAADRVHHFRCFRVREATDRTPRFSVLLGRVPRPPRPSSRMRDVEAGESERLYRPARPGPVVRRAPGDFGKLRFRLKWQIADNP